MLTNESIAQAVRAPLENVEATWPFVVEELKARGIYSKNVAVAMAATIAVETGIRVKGKLMTFLSVREGGGDAYLNRMYDRREDLGNTPEVDGDGAEWAGRGHIQLTGKRNYGAACEEIPIPGLLDDPDLALEPGNAAKIDAWFFATRRVAEAADAGQWERVRRRVNGGTNNLAEFQQFVARLLPLWEEE